MKRFFLITLLLFIGLKAISQVNDEETETFNLKGKYFETPDEELNKFKGTWVYAYGSATFKIKIEVIKKFYVSKTKHYIDKLIAYFCLNDKGSGCTLNYNQNKMVVDFSEEGLYGDFIYLRLIDPISGKMGKGYFYVTSDNTVDWRLFSSTFAFGNSNKFFSLPTNSTLIKE